MMAKRNIQQLVSGLGWLICAASVHARNPLVMDQFTADPTARVFDGKIYVYPSHDILPPPEARQDWFCMEDYHVFSSTNLMDWTDHGVIVSQTNVPWVDASSYSMWAPDCVTREGKYYFYFPAKNKSGEFSIGVAVSDTPIGPFKPEPNPIAGVRGIDPCVFIDKDGSAYLYYSLGKIYVAKLKENMTELETEPQVIDNLPKQGLIEGPFMFERNGIYYLTYPHVEHQTERLEYATADNPLGPFKPAGVIKDESPSGCWTVHHSILEYKGQWILFYHDNDLSPGDDKRRSIRANYLSFGKNGKIEKVTPTLRGVGTADAQHTLQVDRYSDIGSNGAAVSFLDDDHRSEGWKATFTASRAWIRYNRVDFGKGAVKSIRVRAQSPEGGTLEIRLDKANGPVVAQVRIKAGTQWDEVEAPLKSVPSGVHDLFVTQRRKQLVEMDWIRFE